MGNIAIRKWSVMNPWIDFTVFVPADKEEEAEEAIAKAYDAYWDEEYEAYGDAVWDTLRHVVHDPVIIYISDFEDYDEEAEDSFEYEEWFRGLDCPKTATQWRA